ncbi:MAG: prolyl oligopeptidase family serine peptidase, partial [Acidobacteriaceae bacterium]
MKSMTNPLQKKAANRLRAPAPIRVILCHQTGKFRMISIVSQSTRAFCLSAFRYSILGTTAVLFVVLSTASSIAQTTVATNSKNAHAQTIANLLEELDRTRTPNGTEISPDGHTVAWVAALKGSGSRIHLTRLNDTAASPRMISIPGLRAEAARPCSEDDVTWSPNGKQIAFLSDCATPGQKQVFLANQDLSESGSQAAPAAIRQLTALKGFVRSLAWSPDGRQIGFLFVQNATRRPSASAAIEPKIGVIGASTLAEIQRVAVVDAAQGSNRMPELIQVTPENLHVYEFDWSPNSRDLAYVAATPPGDDNWWVAQLYTQAVAGGTPTSILKPSMQIGVPRWSPDGKRIAFIGGLMSDQGVIGGDVYVISAAGGRAKNLTPDRRSSATSPYWIGGHRLGLTEIVGGDFRFSIIDASTGVEDKSARVTLPATVGQFSLSLSSNDGSRSKNAATEVTAAFVKSTFNEPPEVWAGPLKNLVQITHLNDSLKPDWGKSQSLTWNNEGFQIQGWLVFPKNYDPQKKYPLIVWVHGGPTSQVMPRWPRAGYNPIAFSTLNYFVLMPNPRGSYGGGEAFTRANRRDFGYGDLRDILAGVDV